jgi:monoamine oxidase
VEPAVIVLGAGVAGLSAARVLSQSRIPVVILEARHRVGGRVHTVGERGSSVPVEIGAEFVHGRPPEIPPLPAIETGGEDWCFRNGRLERPSAIFQSTEGLMAGLSDAPEQSFAEFVSARGTDDDALRWATGYIEGFHAARPDEIGVRGIALANRAEDAIEGDRSFRLAGGYATLLDWLRQDVTAEIHCDVVVQSVAWRRGRVEVQAQACPRSFLAERLICTLPLGVLASGDVHFDPEPADLRDAFSAIAMGHAAHIRLRFRRRVWEDRPELRGLGFLFSQEAWMPTWWTAAPSEEPVLTGWTGGPRAEAAPADPADWVDSALVTLGKLLGRDPAELRRELVSWHAHNWTADPFSRGAYSYVRVGGLDALRRFGEPVEDTLYFAGEAVNAEGYWSTVNGAMASGERAARLVLNRIGVQSL